MTPDQIDTLGVWLLLIAFSWTILFQCGRIWERWSWHLAHWQAERLGTAPPSPRSRVTRYALVVTALVAVLFLLPW